MHIIQERIKGRVLEAVWDGLSAEEKDSCMLQMKDCVEQLRGLRAEEPGRVQSVDGSGLIDSRIDEGIWGPFESHAVFPRVPKP